MRLVTRGDLDGLTCAVIITGAEQIDEIVLIHPQDITEGRAEIEEGDILANLPYHPLATKWFDHHMHTATPAAPPPTYEGSFGEAPSAAHLVYEYYGGVDAMPEYEELVRETDRLDSADLSPVDILEPAGFIRLGYTIDSRTGLGGFQRYFLGLVDRIRENPLVDAVMELPEVKRRCEIMEEEDASFRVELEQYSIVDQNVVVTDFRRLDHVPIGNRFLVYALYPKINVSVRLHWGPGREYPLILLGHSLVNRTCATNLGELAARYGGGGHHGAASVPLMDDPDQQIAMIIAELKANG